MGSLRDIQRSGSDGLGSGVPTSSPLPGQLIASFERAELTQQKSSFRLEEARCFSPIRDEIYEDVKVYFLGEHRYLIRGFSRSYFFKGFGEEPPIEKVMDSEIKIVTRRKYWLFGPKITVKKFRSSGWVAMKDRTEVEMEVRGTLLLKR